MNKWFLGRRNNGDEENMSLEPRLCYQDQDLWALFSFFVSIVSLEK